MPPLNKKNVFSRTIVVKKPSIAAVKIAENILKKVSKEEQLWKSKKSNIVKFRETVIPELDEYYKGNKSLKEIAKKHEMTETNLTRYMDEFGLPRGRRKRNVFQKLPPERQKEISEKMSEGIKKQWERKTEAQIEEMVDKGITTKRLKGIQIAREHKAVFKNAVETIRKGANPSEVEIALIKKGIPKSESKKITDKAVATIIREIEEKL